MLVLTMVRRHFITGAAVLLTFGAGCGFSKDFEESIQPFFSAHCVSCHGQNDKVKGKVNLLDVDSEAALRSDPDLITELIDVIEFEEMPPEDEPQPTDAERLALVKALEAMLHESVDSEKVYAHAPLRRMNRFQYSNAVKDLLDLRVEVFSLPERLMRDHKNYFDPASGKMGDHVRVGSRPLGKSQLIEPRLQGVSAFPQDLRAEHGFDNRGDHLSLSPLLMESFLRLSQSVTRSRDFTPKNVGIWKTFFVQPPGVELREHVPSILEPFFTKAFRRPPEQEVLDRYAGFVLAQMEHGVSYQDAMKSVASAVMASPKFLYLYDYSGQSEVAEAVDDYELASRLAFFLWGSLPDTELLALAEKGQLGAPEELDQQIGRMLQDKKLKRFCDSFPSQWLQLDRIISSSPDREHFQGFYFSKY
ncbi:MAG: DUF1592 domain-containing protein, partial [Verrucomicrobiota bacterium]